MTREEIEITNHSITSGLPRTWKGVVGEAPVVLGPAGCKENHDKADEGNVEVVERSALASAADDNSGPVETGRERAQLGKVEEEFVEEDQTRDLAEVDEKCAQEDRVSDTDDDGYPLLVKSRHALNRWRQRVGNIVSDARFQNFIVFLIVVNALMMGIGTFDFVTDDPRISAAFEKTDLAFLIIFTIELVMQFFYHGLNLFRDGWLVFDFVIIVISWSLSSLQIIRAFRIFRALRLLTRVEVLRNLVSALLNVMPRLGAITALLLLVFYIFAVMFTVLFKDLDLSEGYFVSLDASLFTLLQIMTLDWVNPARECMEYYSWAWAPFVVFVMITAFIVYNLIIAVVCDAVAMVEHGDGTHLYTDEFSDGGEEFSTASAPDLDSVKISRTKISELRNRIEQLKRNEQEMQKSIDRALQQLGIECVH